jgi:uncharacterized protein YebE (UPF0316 family)
MSKININGVVRDMTDEEISQNVITKEFKLNYIKELRLKKLIETDYLALSDNTMPDNIKTWRQSLRDLPQNNTTETQYDALLARDSDGNLTNSIWSKP